ncbi:MAG TPA: DUF2948 family protein [Devosiaceae bacterium]|nr:DUF2948 family protein [Devosiaceae bacterium]
MTELKLLALDSEDLEVISAVTQDAVIRVADLGYAVGDKRFAALMNRYAWEVAGGRSAGQRRRAALSFARVEQVAYAHINMNAAEGVLELLDIKFEPTEAPAGTIELRFAGGGTIRLGIEVIEARLEDLGAVWAAKAKPEHSV